MVAISKALSNEVTAREIDFASVVDRLRQGPEDPYAQYEFGNGRKRFMSNRQSEGFYDKPVSISGGVTTHLPDPDMVSTNP